MSRRTWLIGAAVAVVLAVALAVVLGSGDAPGTGTESEQAIAEWDPGTPPPDAARRSARRLVSPDPVERRTAVTPELAETLGEGERVPDRADVVLDANGWREHEGYAVATGVLVVPDVPDERIVVGFVDISGEWLVTFEESV